MGMRPTLTYQLKDILTFSCQTHDYLGNTHLYSSYLYELVSLNKKCAFIPKVVCPPNTHHVPYILRTTDVYVSA